MKPSLTQLVSLNLPTLDAEPFTTSSVIADAAQVSHHAVQQLIKKHHADIEEFGIIAFEMRKTGKRGRPSKLYQLNEQQATLVITYLDNTAPVREFKKALVRQFYDAREELIKRRTLREIEKPARRSLIGAIKGWEFCKSWSYKNMTDLLYKTVTGMTVKQLRAARGVDPKATGLNLLSSAEFAQYQRLEAKVIDLLEYGMPYDEIKQHIQKAATQEEKHG